MHQQISESPMRAWFPPLCADRCTAFCGYNRSYEAASPNTILSNVAADRGDCPTRTRVTLSSRVKTERLARQRRAFDQRTQFRPGDLRMRTAAEATIGAGDDVLFAYELRVTLQALRDEFRMFD